MIDQTIAATVQDDGITFDVASIRAEEIRESDDYVGIRATFTATLDKVIIPLQVDVGFGDAITPGAEDRTYPVLLGMTAPKLRMYPAEIVIAEKLEAAVKFGLVYSRMRHFYDQTLNRAIAMQGAKAPLKRPCPAGPATASTERRWLPCLFLDNSPS